MSSTVVTTLALDQFLLTLDPAERVALEAFGAKAQEKYLLSDFLNLSPKEQLWVTLANDGNRTFKHHPFRSFLDMSDAQLTELYQEIQDLDHLYVTTRDDVHEIGNRRFMYLTRVAPQRAARLRLETELDL